MAIDALRHFIDRLLGQTTAQQIRAYQRELDAVNALSEEMSSLSDEQLQSRVSTYRQQMADGASRATQRVSVYAAVREAAVRTVGLRPYDVQIVGGLALDDRRIAEMQTGEGKTLVATLPATLNALCGKVHVVTVNDYLARRDREWMGPVYEFLGLTVGLLQEGISPEERQRAYSADITYGTNHQFGFDYLRDNMVLSKDQKVQGALDFAIVDEIDNILIDEARTPLIISGSASEALDRYRTFAQLTRRFKRDVDFEMDEESRRLTLTDEGIRKTEQALSIDNVFSPEHTETLHYVENALRALHFYKKEQQYIVKDGRVMIVDEFTGRLMPDRRYSDGLHQAIEAKEGLQVQRESQTLAQITLQHYFQLYRGLCGMTGTAKTEEDEFKQIYALTVLEIPTNRPLRREASPDRIFRTQKAKFDAIAEDVEALHRIGRPMLIGTTSIDTSEYLSELLKKRKLPHHVLNAKFHEQEAEIVAQAGQPGAITVATNMAGRGTDITLGEGVAAMGGLHVIGCQRHESRRIDNQLLGRAGRQGDPGSSQFYLSMEDDLLRVFGGDRIGPLMERLGMKEGEAIEHSMLSSAVRRAQKRVEGRNFEIRKRLLEFDLVLSRQRDAIYAVRDRFLLPERSPNESEKLESLETDLEEYLDPIFEEICENLVASYAPASDPDDEWNLQGLAQQLQSYGSIGPSHLQGQPRAELARICREHMSRSLALQKERLGTSFSLLARYIILHTIDEAWRTHLYTLDDLKGGIGWSAFGGTDPLVAFKRESFSLFQEMLARAAESTCKTLLNPRLEIPGQPVPHRQQDRPLRYIHDTSTAPNVSSTAVSTPAARKTATPGRNDPCPCGSGKKYKKCCGA
jgi:preprotein translocase subunit SecA